jgi:hypothetical protein
MRTKKRCGRLSLVVAWAGVSLAIGAPLCFAQEGAASQAAPSANASGPKSDADSSADRSRSITVTPKSPPRKEPHGFWDKENDWLFAGVGASRTLDYFSTLNMRRRGRQEILLNDDVVDNHAAFASIEAAATGTSIALAYLFHRYGHHKLERWTSIVHIGLTTTGAVRNYCLQTAHFVTTPSSP